MMIELEGVGYRIGWELVSPRHQYHNRKGDALGFRRS